MRYGSDEDDKNDRCLTRSRSKQKTERPITKKKYAKRQDVSLYLISLHWNNYVQLLVIGADG